MKHILSILILIILSGCIFEYNAEVVSIDSIIKNEQTTEPIIEEPQPEEPAPTTNEAPEAIPEEEPQEQPSASITYEAVVITRTGASSYRIRTIDNKDLRIFTREQLNLGDKIQFTQQADGTITDVIILERARTHY